MHHPAAQLPPEQAPRTRNLPPAAPPQAAPAVPPERAQAERAQSGWLSNLLAAASRDEPQHSHADQKPPADTLDAISTDIASLIDQDAAAEMWDRWRRGDSAAVSRRLYTAQGQQTFDEIRRRCRSDAQFAETVARYIQEFERLLAKIGQNDRDGSQGRAYLLSDTGKVYTMLAHASGRLG